jgi:peptidoglycan/LPS O-acetylase OafA/YrhL
VAALAVHPWVVIVNPATRFLGRISFSIYLLHFYALEIVGRSMPGIMGIHPHASLRFAEAFTMTLAVAVPICFATYRLVELPGITAGKRISQTISSIALHPRMEPRAE